MISKIKSLIFNKTIQNISLVTFGNFFNAGLGFIALILVSRALGPEGYGVFSVIFGFYALINKFGDLGSNHTAAKYISYFKSQGEKETEKKVAGFFIGATYLFITVSLLIMVPFYKQIASILNVPEYANFVLMAIVLSSGIVLFNSYNIILQSLEKFKEYLYSYTTAGVLKLAVISLLFFLGSITVFNSLFIYFMAPLVGFFAGRYVLEDYLGYEIKPNLDLSILKKMTPFFYFMAIASFASALSEQLGIFMSKILFTSYETGLYAAATKLSMAFALITGSIGTVLIPRASRYTDLENIKRFARKALMLGGFVFLLVLPVVFFPEFFITITTGPEFTEAGPLLSILAIVGGIGILKGSFTSVFYSLNKASYFALTSVLTLVIELPLMYYLGSKIGINGLVYTKLITSVLFLIIAGGYYYYSIKKVE